MPLARAVIFDIGQCFTVHSRWTVISDHNQYTLLYRVLLPITDTNETRSRGTWRREGGGNWFRSCTGVIKLQSTSRMRLLCSDNDKIIHHRISSIRVRPYCVKQHLCADVCIYFIVGLHVHNNNNNHKLKSSSSIRNIW